MEYHDKSDPAYLAGVRVGLRCALEQVQAFHNQYPTATSHLIIEAIRRLDALNPMDAKAKP